MDLNEIEWLLKSDDPKDLEEARRLTREILTDITSKMSILFLDRLELMWLIASSKRNSEAILQLDREYELIKKFSELAEEKWEDKQMIEMLIWLITASWKEKQRQILDRNSVFVKENIDHNKLLSNLLELTKLVANNYDEYWNWFSATNMAREFENNMLKDVIWTVKNKWVCLDLWCANWWTTRLLSWLWFEKVIWYDVSPDMLNVWTWLNNHDKVEYVEHNLFKWIPQKDNSADFIVSNFWSASEVHPNIISEVWRVLKKWWKAFLSFYNKKAIMNDWWQPWQWSIEAIINPEDDILEVPIINLYWKSWVFKIYARSVSSNDIEHLIEWTWLKSECISSHSSISAMMPPMFFKDKKRVEQIREFEKYHSKQKPYIWFYLTIVLSK